MSLPTVFVVGATGIVGGAVARHLISVNWIVHATVRNPDSEASKELKTLGVKLFNGTWDDEGPLAAALAGCSALFLNPYHYPTDTGEEVRWSNLIVTIARAAGVRQIVYSSMLGTDHPEKLRYLDPLVERTLASKRGVDELVRAANFQYWTILRPGFFMANFLLPQARFFVGLTDTSCWTTALKPDSPMPMVDEDDIALFTTAALQDPSRFNEKEIEVASELRSPDEIVKALSKVAGREIRAVYLADEEVEEQKANPFVGGYVSLRDMHVYVDIDQVRSWGLHLSTFEEYLARKTDIVQKTYRSKA